MALLAFGINHETAPIDVRERTAFLSTGVASAVEDLMSLDAVNEAVILSTCNRVELYSDVAEPDVLVDWFASRRGITPQSLHPHLYFHWDDAAVQHIARVACGLDSMVLGEPQIFGQMKTAVATAKESGGVGRQFDRLFSQVFSISKHIRTHTQIGAGPVSLAYATVKLAKHIFSDLSQCTVLLVGAGQTIELAALHLAEQGVAKLIVANRTYEKAKKCVERFDGDAISIADIPARMAEADIVVSATASSLPLLGKGLLERVLKQRKHKPMFIADLAVPRDVEPEVGDLEDVYLYNIDDLKSVIEEGIQNRKEAAAQAEEMLGLKVSHVVREMRVLDVAETVQSYRNKVGVTCDEVVVWGKEQLRRGAAPEQVMVEVARRLANKLAHSATISLRGAAIDGDYELLQCARKLLDF